MPSCRYPPPPLDSKESCFTTQPASGPCSCDESVQSLASQVIPAADPFLGFDPPELAPTRPGARFVRDASPLTLRRLDVDAAWASGYCDTNGSVDPSPDLQLSWASLPSDDLGAPYAVPRGGLIASPHAPSHADGESSRSMPVGHNATTDPGPVARHRRHSVCEP